MNQDEIIRMAHKAGSHEYGPLTRNWSFELSQIESFAALVAEATKAQPQGEPVADALRHAAQIVELYDDATMTGDYMIDSTDCAGILNALAEYHARFYTTPPSVDAVAGSDDDTDKAAELGWHLQAQINAAIEATKEKAAKIADEVLGENNVSAAIRSMK